MKRSVAEQTSRTAEHGAPKTVAESIYRRLRNDIVWGSLAPGAPLRSDELRAKYDVGVSPLREALTRLVSERLVTSIGQRGFRVAAMTPEDVQDTKATRLVIEREALSRSIKAGDIAWETGVVAAFHSLSRVPIPKRSGEASEIWATFHRQFHMALIAACGSRWQMELAGLLFDQAERHRVLRARLGPEIKLKRDIEAEHRAIFEAAMARDVAGAVRALEKHYETTANQVVSALTRKHRIVRST